MTRMAKTSGCALSGFVLVKKVPGSMHFLAKSPSHTFDHNKQNLSHVVNYFCAPPAAFLRLRCSRLALLCSEEEALSYVPVKELDSCNSWSGGPRTHAHIAQNLTHVVVTSVRPCACLAQCGCCCTAEC